jgi:putative transposase
MKRHERARELVTDKLRSYGADRKELGVRKERITGQGENNRAENSHQPFLPRCSEVRPAGTLARR